MTVEAAAGPVEERFGVRAAGIRVTPDAGGQCRTNAAAMDTLLTVLTIAVVVAILAAVVWVFVVAPFWVPRHSRR